MELSVLKFFKLNLFWQNYERFSFLGLFSLVNLLYKLQTSGSQLSLGVGSNQRHFSNPYAKSQKWFHWHFDLNTLTKFHPVYFALQESSKLISRKIWMKKKKIKKLKQYQTQQNTMICDKIHQIEIFSFLKLIGILAFLKGLFEKVNHP